MKRNSGNLDAQQLGLLALVSLSIIAAVCVTMALNAKDRKIARAAAYIEQVETKNSEFLAALLSCANGAGYTLDMAGHHHVHVQCVIQYEYVAGRFYEKDTARQPRKKK